MMQNINMANQWCLRYLKKDKHTDTGTNVGTEKCTGRLTDKDYYYGYWYYNHGVHIDCKGCDDNLCKSNTSK